jgi:hypothetical protein
LSGGGRTPRLVSFTDGPDWLPAVAIVPALLLTILFYVEMNVSTLLVGGHSRGGIFHKKMGYSPDRGGDQFIQNNTCHVIHHRVP